MGTANTKATIVSNADADPRVMNPPVFFHGRVREQIGIAEIAAADDTASKYRVGRVHSSWRICGIFRKNDAITCGSDYNVGLYDTAENGAGDVDENLFADAISLATESKVPVDDMNEALGIENNAKRIYEMLGLSADPNKWYDLVYTGIAPGTGAGTLVVRTQYVDGS